MTRKPDVRYIRPESVQLGDLILVAFEENNDGIIVTKTARVAKREYEGSERVFKTAQQAELFRWAPGHKGPRITLLDRPIENDAETLFGSEVWVFDDA